MLKDYKLHNDLNRDKLFLLTQPPALDTSGLPALPKDWLKELAIMCYGDAAREASYENPFNKHLLGLSEQSELSRTVQLIFRRLCGHLNEQLGALLPDNRVAIIYKLTEDIEKCTEGFTNRVNIILFAFLKPQSLDHLLYKARKCLVEEEVATKLKAQNVHNWNRVGHVAASECLGVQPNFTNDPYGRNDKSDLVIAELKKVFEEKYTPFFIPYLLAQQLHGILVDVGYVGRKTVDDGGYLLFEIESMIKWLKCFLSDLEVCYENAETWDTYFIIESEHSLVLDINWKLVRQYFFEALIKQEYFLKQPEYRHLPDHAAHNNLYPDNPDQCIPEAGFIAELFKVTNYQQLSYIKGNFPDYYKQLVKNEHFLKKYTARIHDIYKKLKEDKVEFLNSLAETLDLCCEETISMIQPLFLQQDFRRGNVLMYAAEYRPDIAEIILQFFTEHKACFSSEVIQHLFLQQNSMKQNVLMLAMRSHFDLAKKMLQFFTEHQAWFSSEVIRKLFLQQDCSRRNVLMYVAEYRPNIAEIILRFFTEHKAWFSSAVIQQLFLLQNNMERNVLTYSAEYRPNIAEIILQFFTEHKACFSSEVIQHLFLQQNSMKQNVLMLAMRSHFDLAKKMLQFFTEHQAWFSSEVIRKLFLQQDCSRRNVLMYVAEYRPKIAEIILRFFTEHQAWFSSEVIRKLFLQQNFSRRNVLMYVAEYRPNIAEIILRFFTEHKAWFSSAVIQQLFLQQNNMERNVLTYSAEYQPGIAKKMLQFFTEHQAWFSSEVIQQLFPQQNSMEQNVLMLAMRSDFDLAKKMLQFFTEHKARFSSEVIQKLFLQQDFSRRNVLMYVAEYRPKIAEIILRFFIEHKAWFSSAVIQQLFLQQNNMERNVLTYSAEYRPDIAEIILQFFTEHKAWFSSEVIQHLFLQQNNMKRNVLMRAMCSHFNLTKKMLQFFTEHKAWFSSEVIQQLFLPRNNTNWNALILAEQTSPQINRAIFNFLAFNFNRYSSSVTPEEKEIAKFLFAQFDKWTLNEWERQDLCRRMSSNTALLLLRFFDKDCVQGSTCLAKITPILFAFYREDLSTRKGITHSECFFECKEMEGATVLKATLSKDHSREELLALRKKYIGLNDDPLRTLYEAYLQIASSTPAYSRTKHLLSLA